MSIVNKIFCALDEDKIFILLFLDLSAAFDTICHEILLSCFDTFFWYPQCTPILEKKQFVMVQDNQSSTASLDFGVPQGSVLGPVLFILYTTPLSLIIEKHSANHEMFADDTQLRRSDPPTDYDSMVLSLQKCTADIKDWMLENKRKLNDEKTEAVCFSPPSFGLAYSLSDSIFLGSCNIQFTQKVKDLGVWLDSDHETTCH